MRSAYNAFPTKAILANFTQLTLAKGFRCFATLV